MKRSLNEIEVAARRAAIGAGLPVGLAQDVSAAVAWLVARGLDGAGCLAALLEGVRREPSIAEQQDGSLIFADGRVEVCGASAIDLLLSRPSGASVTVKRANAPLLLAGLAGAAAVQHGVAFELVCAGNTLLIAPETLDIDATCLTADCDVTLSCRKTDGADDVPLPDLNGFIIDDANWRKIAEFAYKTYVPASEASRLTGAGAGLTDND
jgi:hypothetical protein